MRSNPARIVALACLPLIACAPPRIGAADAGPVSIRLERVEAMRTSSGDLDVRCVATLTNTTGHTIHTRTNFASAFDGFSAVVSSEDGAELARQSYLYHQSPYAEDSDVPLSEGTTTKEIVFPIMGLAADLRVVRVRLEGGLLGTPYERGIVSNEMRAEITRAPW